MNVHGATPFISFLNGNAHEIGMVIGISEGELLKLSTCVLLANSALENKLNALHCGLIKAFDDNYKEVIVETNNLNTFMLIEKKFHLVFQNLAGVTQQIFVRVNDPRCKCIIAYIFPGLNPVEFYLARIDGERCDQLYTLFRPVRAL